MAKDDIKIDGNDISVPAALIFIDSLGSTLPLKSAFTFKELSDFCRREGINHLAGKPTLSSEELLHVAEIVQVVTGGHITIESLPSEATTRTPLSAVDLSVANVKSEVRTAQAPRQPQRVARTTLSPGDITLYSYVTLKNGTSVHVVECNAPTYIGMDDSMLPHTFVLKDAASVHHLDDAVDIHKIGMRCGTCGEHLFEFTKKCSSCGEVLD